MLDRVWRGAATESSASELPPEIAFLEGQVARHDLAAAAVEARRNATAPHDELTALGILDSADYALALAEHLGLDFRTRLQAPEDPDGVAGQAPEAAVRTGMMTVENGPRAAAVAALARGPIVPRLIEATHRIPASAPRLVITPPQAFLDGLIARTGDGLAAAASRTVERVRPGQSARGGLALWQMLALGSLLLTAAFGAFATPGSILLALLIVSSVFFLGVAGLRVVAAAMALSRHGDPQPGAPRALSDAELPVFTVLVPLYREAHMIGPLIAALDQLDYPRAKLDIKLIVESDDAETQEALRARRLPGCYDVVTVPDAPPKTKPKALNFALALSRGALVTIFDAEDWPQPDQLRRAAAAFAGASPEVACFQARLAWYNWTDNWLTRGLMAQTPQEIR